MLIQIFIIIITVFTSIYYYNGNKFEFENVINTYFDVFSGEPSDMTD
jgi:hypothetical protein